MLRARNIGLWFGSLILGVGAFSVAFGPGSFFFMFRITMIFAAPVAILYLPFVVGLRDAEGGRIWAILAAGLLIGPVSLALWGLLGHVNWRSNDIGPGLGGVLLCAFVVGLLTTSFYVTGLKIRRLLDR